MVNTRRLKIWLAECVGWIYGRMDNILCIRVCRMDMVGWIIYCVFECVGWIW